MGSGPQVPTRWTYSEYARLPNDGGRYEVIDGELLMTPAPTPAHQHVAATLYRVLQEYVEQHDLGVVLRDVDLLIRPGQFLRPDLVFVPEARRAAITDRGVEGVPGLVVEVVSPSSASVDRMQKPRRYQEAGIRGYWVVDPEARAVESYDLRGSELVGRPEKKRLLWQPGASAPPLEVAIQPLFRGL